MKKLSISFDNEKSQPCMFYGLNVFSSYRESWILMGFDMK